MHYEKWNWLGDLLLRYNISRLLLRLQVSLGSENCLKKCNQPVHGNDLRVPMGPDHNVLNTCRHQYQNKEILDSSREKRYSGEKLFWKLLWVNDKVSQKSLPFWKFSPDDPFKVKFCKQTDKLWGKTLISILACL